MRACVLAGIALTDMKPGAKVLSAHGMTLIELVIVMAVMGILLTLAVPSYQSYMLRVHRTEAIRMLLQASMCQQRIYASHGNYDTRRCRPDSEYQRYQVTYQPPDTQGRTYIAMASPKGAQLADACGSLSLDQNGARSISGVGGSIMKCWNGR
jgi:type IV pilus assembly protein PilE